MTAFSTPPLPPEPKSRNNAYIWLALLFIMMATIFNCLAIYRVQRNLTNFVILQTKENQQQITINEQMLSLMQSIITEIRK